MKKNFTRPAIFTAAILATAAAAALIISAYSNGTGFQPTGADRALQTNQVLFPEQNSMSALDTEQNNSDSFWETDDLSDRADGGRGSNDGYLFSSDTALPSSTGNAVGISTGTGTASGDGTADSFYEIVDGNGGADLILPGGGTLPGTSDSDDNSQGDDHPSVIPPSDNTTTPSQPDTIIDGGNETPAPAPSPVPTTPVVKDVVDPDEYEKYEPADIGMDIKKVFNEDKITEPDENYRFIFTMPFGGKGILLYTGQTIDSRVVYCAFDTYLIDSNNVMHYFDSDALGKYIRIDAVSFESEDGPWEDLTDGKAITIPNDASVIYVKAYYRFHLSDKWVQYLPVPRYPYLQQSRIIVLNTQLPEGTTEIDSSWVINSDSFNQNLELGSILNLFYWQQRVFRDRGVDARAVTSNGTQASRQPPLSVLFPGWVENGTKLDWFYPVTRGRHLLEALDFVPLDTDRYQVELTQWYIDTDCKIHTSASGLGKLSYLQTLTYYKDTVYDSNAGINRATHIDVPEYVQAVQVPYSAISTDYLNLSSTVLYVDTSGRIDPLNYNLGLEVRKGYTVSKDNPYFTAQNGILFNAMGTEILGVPTDATALTVDAGVTRVVLPNGNHLKTLTLYASSLDEIPEINYENVGRNCCIVVKSSLFADYVRANAATLRTYGIHVAPANDPVNSHTVQDNLLLSGNKQVHLVVDPQTRWLSLPNGITGMDSGALNGLNDLTTLFLPQNGSALTLADDCFDGAPNLELIVCYSTGQYNAALAAAPEGVQVQLVTIVNADGFTYEELSGRIVLLNAPKDLTEFDGVIPDGNGGTVTVDAIGEAAFADCDDLQWVDLPEQTASIGYRAFAGCISLEGVVIDAPTVMIGKESFDGCYSLRFIASNAETCDLQAQDLSLPAPGEGYCFLFAPTVNQGYNNNWISFVSADDIVHYEMVDCGGTRVLYGVDSSDEDWIALRSGAKADGVVTLPSTTSLIFWHAFQNAGTKDGSSDLTIDFSNLTQYYLRIEKYAFASSSLGSDVVLPADVTYGENAFSSCNRLKSVTLPSEFRGNSLAEFLFDGCSSLEKVTIGYVAYDSALRYNMFSECNALRTLEFTEDVPTLLLAGYGTPYRFNLAWTEEEEQELLHIVTDIPEQFIANWRYPMTGYSSMYDMSSYQVLWYYTYVDLYDTEPPSNAEVTAEVDRRLLAAENQLRAMMWLDPIDEIVHQFQYEEADDQTLTLTGAQDVTWATLEGADMDLPYGWAIDYIGENAFAESPNLRDVDLPSTLVGIRSGAFNGVTFDIFDSELRLWLYGEDAPALYVSAPGVPFDFGVDDEAIALRPLNSSFLPGNLIRDWTFPMAGYDSYFDMHSAYLDDDFNLDEERLNAALIEAENRVRAILYRCGYEEYEPIDSADDLICLTERETPEESEFPELPDNFNLSADVPEEPNIPQEPDTPEEPDAPQTPDTPEDSELQKDPDEPEESEEDPDTPKDDTGEENPQPEPSDDACPDCNENEEEI